MSKACECDVTCSDWCECDCHLFDDDYDDYEEERETYRNEFIDNYDDERGD